MVPILAMNSVDEPTIISTKPPRDPNPPAFLSIVFIQSALDKIFNWKGNLEFTASKNLLI